LFGFVPDDFAGLGAVSAELLAELPRQAEKSSAQDHGRDQQATGLYRYVRNPMYVAVVAVIFGQAILFGDWRLFAYGAAFWLVCHLFVVGYEEPTLTRLFGAEYETFRMNLPHWIPRLTAWRGR
jgi:protein-S-isoprenylcysteine O-methyltransferase Ste14